MHQELVERRRWISERRFLHALNYCMVLPGPEAQQLATYIGWLMHRTRGGIAAGALFVLPSLAILIALSWIYVAYGDVPAIAGAFYGIKPAVSRSSLFAAWRLGSRALDNGWAVAIAVARASSRSSRSPLPFPLDRRSSPASIGFVGGRIEPATFSLRSAHGAGARRASAGADRRRHADAGARASSAAPRFARVLVVSLALWARAHRRAASPSAATPC